MSHKSKLPTDSKERPLHTSSHYHSQGQTDKTKVTFMQRSLLIFILVLVPNITMIFTSHVSGTISPEIHCINWVWTSSPAIMMWQAATLLLAMAGTRSLLSLKVAWWSKKLLKLVKPGGQCSVLANWKWQSSAMSRRSQDIMVGANLCLHCLKTGTMSSQTSFQLDWTYLVFISKIHKYKDVSSLAGCDPATSSKSRYNVRLKKLSE